MRNIEDRALHLQWMQEQHDQHYHADIYTLSRADNLTHMVMHLAKYLGKLMELQQGIDNNSQTTRQDILTDMLIILTSSANRLNISLGSVYAAVAALSGKQPAFFANTQVFTEHVVAGAVNTVDAPQGQDFICACLIHVGHMSKALEALDHLESFKSRLVLERAVLSLFGLTLVNHGQTSTESFAQAMELRLHKIESAHFLYSVKPNYLTRYKAK